MDEKKITVTTTVTIPDFTADAALLKERAKLAAEYSAAASKTVEIYSDSVLEQISQYLFELFKPFFDENGNTTLGLVRWPDGNRFVEAQKDHYNIWERSLCMAVFCDHVKDGSTQSALPSICRGWPSLKENINKQIKDKIRAARDDYQSSVNRSGSDIDIVKNFVL